jgi:hypothetical protein
MFKVASDTAVPGFRVGLPDEPPGFSIDENGSVHRPLLAAPGAAAFGFDPYGNVLQTMAPTAVRPAGMFYKANSGLFPTPYQAYVPVSGDTPFQDPLRQAVDRANAPISGGTPSQDPLRQAVDRAADLPTGPTHPPATTLTPSQIGGLIGGFIGGTLGGLTRSQTVGRAGTGIGAALGMILGGEYGNGNAGRAISIMNDSGLAGAPGSGM